MENLGFLPVKCSLLDGGAELEAIYEAQTTN